MTKKLSRVLALFIILIVIGWLYLAENFHKIAKEEILAYLKKDSALISFKDSAVSINKYKFRIIMHNVAIFSNSQELKMTPEKIIAFYNPLSGRVSLSIKSDKLLIGNSEFSTYIPNPNISISFNKTLLLDNNENFDIVVKSKNTSFYLTKGDSFLGKADNFKIIASNTVNGNMYDMNLNLAVGKLEIDPNNQLFKKSIHNSLNQSPGISNENSEATELYLKIMSASSPTDYFGNYSLSLGKKHIKNLISFIRGTKKIETVISEFKLRDLYMLKIKDNINNDTIQNSNTFLINNNGKHIQAKLGLSINNNYNEKQKQQIVLLVKTVLFNSIKNSRKNKNNMTLTVDDFTPAAKMITDITSFNSDFDINYDLDSGLLTNKFMINTNNLEISSEGKLENDLYDGKIGISNAKSVINCITTIYGEAVKPVLIKLLDDPVHNVKINYYDLIYQNIKDNGLDALSAFNKSAVNLAEDSHFTTEILFNPKNFKFEVNGKAIFEIMSDQRVIKFLQNMPHQQATK